jgi:Dolichyl-phosphate-mannose-protein mannosyltransferase
MRGDGVLPEQMPIIAADGRPLAARLPHRATAAWCALVVIAWGVMAAWMYHLQGLTLSHYDAKAHLVVARRVIDSITPGWQQIGAVWLPLPHLLNLLPVQVDGLYRTGASGIAISIVSMGVAAYAAAAIVLRASGSRAAAMLCAGLLALNPNILYLQSTPMTEPLLIALLMLGAMSMHAWACEGGSGWRRAAGLSLAAACLTRYEAWPFTGAVLALAPWARWRSGESLPTVLRDAIIIACYPLVAILLFLLNSKLSIGHWFVTGGFYVPDPRLQGNVFTVTSAVWWGAWQLGSLTVVAGGTAAAVVLAAVALRERRRAALVVPLALFAVAALPWYAYFEGHPFRIRYMVPMVAAAILALSLGVGLLPRRVRSFSAALAVAGVLITTRPFDPRAAMVLEAQWDRPNSRARQDVTACLPLVTPRPTIMASMGSLAHYMQELSQAGFSLRDFLHEGNGDIWLAALNGPARYVGWMLIEERAEGGDMLNQRAVKDRGFLAGFERVCAGGGVALYRNRDAGSHAREGARPGVADIRSEPETPPGK